MQLNEPTHATPRVMGEFSSDVIARLEANDLEWQRVTGSPKFDYPIDYSVAFIRADPESGQIEFLAKWEPNSYCHSHRHLGRTSLWVIQGEHHVIEMTETQIIHKTRKPGFRGQAPAGEAHLEYGGPEGAIALFLCEQVDGKMFDILAKDGTVLATATFEDFASGGRIELKKRN